MPIFTYKCSDCGRQFERLEGVLKADEPLVCPGCGSGRAEKLLSTFSVGKSAASGASGKGGCTSCCPTGSCGI